MPLESLAEKLINSAEVSLNLLRNQNEKKNKLIIDEDKLFRRFITDSISVSIFGTQENKFAEIHEIIKFIEEDLIKLETSMKVLLALILPNFFAVKVLRKEICDFFNKVSNEAWKRKESKTIITLDVLQVYVDETSKHSTNDDFIAAQIFTFFAGG